MGGRFDEKQAFSGRMTQIDLWPEEISGWDVRRLANCEVETVKKDSRIIGWDDGKWIVRGPVFRTDEPLAKLCEPNIIVSKLVIPTDVRSCTKYQWLNFTVQLIYLSYFQVSYNDLKSICDKVDGQIPIINDNKDRNDTVSKLHKDVFELIQALPEPDSNIDKCLLGQDRVMFWLGQRRMGDQGYVNPYDPTMNFDNFHVGLALDASDCILVFGGNVESYNCAQKFACGVCELPDQKILKMKGLCYESTQIRFLYDVDYYIYGTRNGRIYYR